ncbi:hypothetical protein B7C51_22705 [Paenibacillus larvae subsp. pulvifaciens]|uniref:NfeD-like C-terminal domain-containing protein n=1 Tax=Paenibacillus larvae subsp. pulvifaciens TaxID=1477 RepID=A0A1V0UY12_9BACL|nr:hypothetical protein B7C51_22705 [Paenibacillus larvae subsp. pulvifaciens]
MVDYLARHRYYLNRGGNGHPYVLFALAGYRLTCSFSCSAYCPGPCTDSDFSGGVVVGVLTFFTKPLTRKFRHSEGYKDAIEEIIGKKGEVMQKIEVGKMGIVRVGNEMWSAIADEQIGIGETVMVVQRKNTIIEVTKWRGV